MRLLAVACAVSLALGLASPAGAAEPAGPPPTAAEEFSKQLQALTEKMQELVAQDIDLQLAVTKAQQMAQQDLKEPAKAPLELAKGRVTIPLRKYKAIHMACIQQLRKFDAQVTAYLKAVRLLESDPAAGGSKPQIALLVERAEDKHRNTLMRIAGLYEKAGDVPTAVKMYEVMRDALPDDKAEEKRKLTESIAGVYVAVEEPRKALAVYKGILDALPEKKTMEDINLMLRVSNLYEQTGDLKAALKTCKDAKASMPPGATAAGLDEKIIDLEIKVRG